MKHDISFLQKCTAVTIQCHSLRFSKKLPKSAMVELTQTPTEGEAPQEIPEGATIGVHSDLTRIRGSKKLLDCDEAAAIAAEFTRVKNFVKDLSLPTPFGDGIFFVPNTRIEQVDTELRQAEAVNVPNLVRAFVAKYDEILANEQLALKENFHLADYDSPREILNRVRMDYAYVTFGIPENLPEAIRQREAEKQGQRLTESIDAMQGLLRSEMAKLVKHAAETLSGTKGDGKKKSFKNTLIGNIRDFMSTFQDRNITDDAEMEAIIARANQLLDGVDPQDLRDSDSTRSAVAQGFAEIQAQLETMMVPRGSRIIQFDDEPTGDIAITTGPEYEQAMDEAAERGATAEAMGLFEAEPEAVTA